MVHTRIIAEAGINNQGELGKSLEMINVAKEAGADFIKFQTFKAEEVTTDPYELSMLKKYELKEEYYPAIINHCKNTGIEFMSTPHGGVESARFLKSLDVSMYKISSADLNNYILLDEVNSYNKPIILSTGMATSQEVAETVEKYPNIKVLLHCTSNYPTMAENVNMRAMESLDAFNLEYGYSDHTTSPTACVMAVTLGATWYECHFTLDKTLPGPDHKASCDPEELKTRIKLIREAEKMMGSMVKEPTDSELKVIGKYRKRIIIENGEMKAKRPLI